MKKYYFLLLLITTVVSSCEKDDFCLEPVTPNLIIRFYDADNPSNFKAVEELFVWQDGRDSILMSVTTDSIAIPLDVNNNQTIYNLSTGTTQDQLIIDYTLDEVFVSRSCGFKANFNNPTYTPNNVWILSTLSITETIENETAAHVQVFH